MIDMRIDEAYMHNLIRRNLNEVMTKRSLINKLYKIAEPFTHGQYHDDGWRGVDDITDALENAGFETYVSVEDGGYRNSKGGNTLFAGEDVSYWKEYKIQVEKDGIVANGIINCHAAGNMDDVFSSYDMTVHFW